MSMYEYSMCTHIYTHTSRNQSIWQKNILPKSCGFPLNLLLKHYNSFNIIKQIKQLEIQEPRIKNIKAIKENGKKEFSERQEKYLKILKLVHCYMSIYNNIDLSRL